MLEPVGAPDAQPTVLAAWASQWVDGMLDGSPTAKLFDLGWDVTAHLRDLDPVALERVFRAVLDTASHRIDPWVTGIASRRLWALAGDGARFRVGAYGWVDTPRPRSAAAPADEYLHAPSEAQALTSAVLRDRARHDAEPGRWDLDLDSERVRLAEQLAAEVRLGAPLVEVVGRAVERVVGDRPRSTGSAPPFQCAPSTKAAGCATGSSSWPASQRRRRPRLASPPISRSGWSLSPLPSTRTATCWWPTPSSTSCRVGPTWPGLRWRRPPAWRRRPPLTC